MPRAAAPTEKNNSDKLSRFMLDSAPFGCVLWDKTGKPIDCNHEAVKLFGTKNKQEYLDIFFDLSPEFQPDGSRSREKASQMAALAHQNGRTVFEWMHQTPDGTLFPVEVTLDRVPESDQCCAGYFRDLRQQNKMLADLVDAEESARLMLDAVPAGCCLWDTANMPDDFRLIDCNRKALEIFGLENREQVLNNFYSLSPEYQPNGKTSRDYALESVQEAYRTGMSKVEWIHQQPNGTLVPVEITFARVRYGAQDVLASFMRDLREERKIRAELSELDERARTMLDMAPLCCSFWGDDFKLIDCNLAAVHMFGLNDKQEFVNRFMDLFPEFQPDGQRTHDVVRQKLTNAFSIGFTVFEIEHRTLNGEPLPTEVTLFRSRRQNKDIVVGYTRDLREQKKALAELKETNERIRLMLNAVPMSCGFWDENLKVVDCNGVALEFFDMENIQEFSDHFIELFPEFQPDGRRSLDAANLHVQQVFDTGYVQFEWTYQKLNGELLPAEVTLSSLVWRGKPIIAGCIRDLRDEKKRLTELREADNRVRAMLNAAPLCCTFRDKNLRILDCNRVALDLFGLKDAQEYNDRLMELFPEFQPDGKRSSEEAIQRITQAFETGYASFEWMYQKFDGTPIPSEVTFVRIPWNNEHILIGYTRDLRAEKKMLAELNAANTRTQIMLNAVPIGCCLWETKSEIDYHLIDCNQTALQMFEVEDKALIDNHFQYLSPEYQPNGKTSRDYAAEMILAAHRTGRQQTEWMHQKLDGTPIPVEITFVRVQYGDTSHLATFLRDLREEKKMLAELNAADERMRAMLDLAPVCCTFRDAQLGVIECNRATLELFGFKNTKEYNDHFYELLPEFQPDGQRSVEAMTQWFDYVLENGYAVSEWMYQKPDGTPIPAEVILIRHTWNDRTIIVGYTRDLREQKKMIAELRESDERMRTMLDAAPLCCNFRDENLRIIDCNTTALELYGFKDKQEYLARWFELSPEFQPDGRRSKDAASQWVKHASDTGYAQFEWLHQKLDGTLIPAEITLVQVKWQDKKTLVGYTRDLRAEKKMIAELREADERTRIMLNAAPWGCSFRDEHLHILDCNPAVLKLFGLKDQQEYSERFAELSPEFQPDGRRSSEAALQYIKQAFDTGCVIFEWLYHTLDGVPIPVEITCVRVKWDDKDIVIGYTRDLRAEKKMLAELRIADEHTRIMHDVTPMCSSLWDENLNGIDCNRETVRMFGLKDKQEFFDRFFELSPPFQPCGRPSREMALENFTAALRDGDCRFEWMHQTLDGTQIPAEVFIGRVQRGDKYILVGHVRDLREQKKILAELREADERIRVMFDSAPWGCYLRDENLQVLDCNLAMLKMLGMKDKQEYSKRYKELMPEFQPNGRRSDEFSKECVARALKDGCGTFEWLYQTVDGTLIPTEITCVRVRWHDQYVAIGYIRDLREQQKMLADLRAADERSRIMLDTAPICCNFWNTHFQNIDCNLAAPKLFGLKDKEEYVARFWELSPEFQPDGQRSHDAVPQRVAQAFDTGYVVFEWMHQTIDGTQIPVEITLVRGQWRNEDIVISYIRDLREQKQMLAALHEADERVRIMLDTTPLCSCLWTEDLTILDCNFEAVKIFDLRDKHEFCTRFFELSPPLQPCGKPSAEMAVEKLAEAFREGSSGFEWMFQKFDGTLLPAEITLVRVQLGGKPIVTGYARDLREEKKMLAALREADERVRIMLDTTPLCCSLWDENLNVLECNFEAVKMFDLKDKNEYCTRFNELSPPFQPCGRPSAELAVEKLVEAFRDGYSCFEWMHQKIDGTPRPAEITLVRVQMGDKPILAGYSRDLREIKKHEAIAAQERQRVHDLLTLAHMIDCPNNEIVDFVLQSVTTLTQSTMAYLLNINEEDAWEGAVPFRALVQDQTFNCPVPINKTAIAHSANIVLECLKTKQPVIHNDISAIPGKRIFPAGHVAVHSHMNVPIMDGNEPMGILAVGNKATPYTETDTEQLTLLAQGLSNVLNRKRFTKKLELARQEAENANAAKSDFLANMSHEIRTPLNGVIGLSDLLLKTPLSDKQQEYAELINTSGQSLLFLINDILDFSKIEAGKLTIDAETFNLCAIVESTLGILISRAEMKNLELAIAFCRNMPRHVVGDAGRVRQILLNLIGNAIKFTEHGGVRISVDVDSVQDTTVTMRFRITDSGIGIPEEQFDRLFKAFSQANDSTTRIYGGTGLGLAISMRLAQLMGGDIGVESEEGKGSTFWFTIPFGCDPAAIQCMRDPQGVCSAVQDKHCPHVDGNFCTAFAHREINETYSTRGRRVLVVDENVVQRETLCIQLRNWDMECSACDSGATALQLLEQSSEHEQLFDLIILDNTLTDGRGIDWTHRIIDWENKKNVADPQIILFRALAEEYDVDFLEENEIEAMSKPVAASALFEAVLSRIFAIEKRRSQELGNENDDSLSGLRPARSKKRTGWSSVNISSGTLHSAYSGKIHLLVVEDNRVNQIVVRNLLDGVGLTCDIANHGHEACEAVRAKHYDVILMDCQMPNMDGYEATRQIRQWEQEQGKKRIPIIALTASVTKDEAQKCFDSGMDAYCSKPINAPVMLRLIDEWYKKSSVEH